MELRKVVLIGLLTFSFAVMSQAMLPVCARNATDVSFMPAIPNGGLLFPILSSADLATVVKAHLAHLRHMEKMRRKNQPPADHKEPPRPLNPFQHPQIDLRQKTLEEIARDRSDRRLPDFQRPAITFTEPAPAPPPAVKVAEEEEGEEEEEVVEIRPDLE